MVKRVSEDIVNVKIPKLLIQPLIENAIYHGIEKRRGKRKGVIMLKAYKKDELCIIEVIDNGAGVDKDELETINDLLSLRNNEYFNMLKGEKRKSIGLENVNRRIKLFYGEEYGMEIFSVSGYYTKVIVTIPLQHIEMTNEEEHYMLFGGGKNYA
jgi:two-component system sensor histidine kinase YesM